MEPDGSNRRPLACSHAPLQLLSLDEGYFSALRGKPATPLVTADFRLASAARALGLAAWDSIREPMLARYQNQPLTRLP